MHIIWTQTNFAYALLAVPLALLLAFLVKRERRSLVASMMPWRSVLARPRPRPHRNPIDLETVCAILLPLCAAAALLQPVLHREGSHPADIAVLLDTSASMHSTGRMDAAEHWLQRIRDAHPNATVRLYGTTVSGVPAKIRPGTLRQIPPTLQTKEAHCRSLDALLAVSSHPRAHVIWISDTPLPAPRAHVTPILVGAPSRNTAITTARVISHNTTATLFATTQHFGSKPIRGNIQIHLDNNPFKRIPFTLTPGAVHMLQETLPATTANYADITLQGIEDDLQLDNRARVRLQRTIASVSNHHFPRIRLALQTMRNCRVVPPRRSGDSDLAATDKAIHVDALPRTAILLLAPKTPCYGLIDIQDKHVIQSNKVRIVQSTTPLPAVTVQGMDTFSLSDSVLPPEAIVLAEAGYGNDSRPLVATWEWNKRNVAWIGALPDTWTAQPGFAVLIGELVKRLLPDQPPVPGVLESDNRLSAPATPADALPSLIRGTENATRYPLHRWLIALAALCGFVISWKEWRRGCAAKR